MSSRSLLPAAMLLALVFVAYQPALDGDFVWDDDQYVSENVTLRSWAGLGRIWFEPTSIPQYYPLTHTSFWIEYRLWRLEPFGYHVTNIVLHAIAAMLLWRVLLLLEIPGAWIAAAIFALHPVHVESVAWITERKNVLSGALYLGSMLAYLRWSLRDGKRKWLYVLALALFALALLSKTVAASLPAAILLVLWWKHGSLSRSDFVPLVPFVAMGMVLGGVTVWLEKVHVGAAGQDWDLSMVERVLIAGRALWFYAGKLAWPVDLIFIYPRWRIDVTEPRQYLYPAGALLVGLALWALHRRIGRGALVAVLFFAGTLVPALGFFDVYPMTFSYVADHFQYLASIGLIVLVVAVSVEAVRRLGVTKAVSHTLAAFVLAVLALQTWRQSHAYENHEALWRDTLRKDPESWMAHTSLGALLDARGQHDEARTHFEKAVAGNPSFPLARVNLGLALARDGELEQAVGHLKEGLRRRPEAVDAYPVLAHALFRQGNVEEAESWFRRSIEHDQADAQLLVALADLLIRRGELDEASLHLRQALTRDPNLPVALFYSAEVLARQGNHAAAAQLFARVAGSNSPLAGQAREALGRLDATSAAKPTPPAGDD